MVPTRCPDVKSAAHSLQDTIPKKIETITNRLSSIRTRPLNEKELVVFTQGNNRGTLNVEINNENWIERLKQIRNCTFNGKFNVLFLDVSFSSSSSSSSSYLSDTTFKDCWIASGAIIERTTLIERSILLTKCRVFGCGFVSGPNETTAFGNDLIVSPGLESGGRATRIVVESSLEHIARVSLDQYRDQEGKRLYDDTIRSYVARSTGKFTILSPHSAIENSPEVSCCFLDERARIASGARANGCTLMEDVIVEKGADAMNSLLQRGVMISTQAIVSNSLVCENGLVDLHGKLLGSILGPGSHLSEGEISSSLIGPMVGFHHQSMLIAIYWPSGRGNVGYGANCGSNHTSRVSDQTMWPGEGIFFGLSCSMKFPLNLSEAPYSVFATGVVFGPGKLDFPFSLVTSGDIMMGCRVAPGWGFSSNAYAIERNFLKMKMRAPKDYAFDVFRPSIASLVWSARRKLKHAVDSSSREIDVFRDGDKFGLNLGGGFVTRSDAIKAISSYTTFLELYVLRGARLYNIPLTNDSPNTIGNDDDDVFFETYDPADTGLIVDVSYHRDHVHRMIPAIVKGWGNNPEVLSLLRERERNFAKNVVESKRRDHSRGNKIFPNGRYDEAIDFTKDAVIASANRRIADLELDSKM